MFAINHAATALLFKRRFGDVSLVALLLSVQAMEFAWVASNYLGVERTTTEPIVRYVGDIHLAYMPYSHSVLTALGSALVVWSIGAVVGRARLGAILGFAMLSHLLLDLLTHNGDIALGPFHDAPKYGTFLYGRLAPLAFLVELAYGVVCWWIFRGSRALLAIVIGFNLANISEFFRSIPGPEDALAGHPLTLVTVILVQIVMTMWAVWWGAGKVATAVGSNRDEDMSRAERVVGLPFVERCGRGLTHRESGAHRHGNLEEIVSTMGASRILTSRERALYRASTGLVLAVMVFSIINFVFNDHFPFPNGPEGAFVHLGFPPYFKVELTIAKILGVLALLIPAVPFKVKEFAYAGFAITLLSAAIAHFGRGDARNLSVLYVIDPLVFFLLLAVSYYYFDKSYSLQARARAGAVSDHQSAAW